ncbi:MAG: hypothetical protein PHS34_08320, partial [Candidatus Omnitrophica bacterium]|nr:hypothetical protein [Candidatus Omnitrophota bacterium]
SNHTNFSFQLSLYSFSLISHFKFRFSLSKKKGGAAFSIAFKEKVFKKKKGFFVFSFPGSGMA